MASANATAGKPDTEAIGTMIAASDAGCVVAFALLGTGGSTELTAPLNQCRIQQAALFEVCQQAADRQVRLFATTPNSGDVVRVRIPRLPGHEDLDKPDPAFDQPPSHPTALAIRASLVVIQTGKLLSCGGLLIEIERICGRELHPRGEFEAGDPGIQFKFTRPEFLMSGVELSQQFHSPRINLRRPGRLWLKMQHRQSFRPNRRALVNRRQPTARPVPGTIDRHSTRIRERNLRRQILTLSTRTVRHPRPDIRSTGNDQTRVRHPDRLFVISMLGKHRANHTLLFRRQCRATFGHCTAND